MVKQHSEKFHIGLASCSSSNVLLYCLAAGLIILSGNSFANENTPQQRVDSIQGLGEAVDFLKASRKAVLRIDARKNIMGLSNMSGKGFATARTAVLVDDIRSLQKSEFGKILGKLDGVLSGANFAITFTEYQFDIYNAYKSGKVADYLDIAQKAVSDTLSNNGLGGMVVGKLFDANYNNIKQIGIEINNLRGQQQRSAEAAQKIVEFYGNEGTIAYYLPTLENLRSLTASDNLEDIIKGAENRYIGDLESQRAILLQLLENVREPDGCLWRCDNAKAAHNARINQVKAAIELMDERIENIRTGGSIAREIRAKISNGMEYLIGEDMRDLVDSVSSAKNILSQKIENGLVETAYIRRTADQKTILVEEEIPTFSGKTINETRMEPILECIGVACPTTPPAPVASTWAGQIAGAKGYSNGANAGSVMVDGAVTATGVTNGQMTNLTVVTQSGISGTASGVAHIDGGYQYTAWGEWNGRIDGDGVQQNISNVTHGQWVVGSPTKDSPAVRQIGQATYSGNLMGDYVASNGTLYQNAVGGSMRMQVDFTGMTVDSYLHILRASDNATIADTSVTGSQIYTAQTNGATYFGYNKTQSGANGAVTGVVGTFYGPNAEEAGGSWSYHSPTQENISGVFRAKR